MNDFIGNENAVISTGGFHNNSNYERESNDFYATNPQALIKLLRYETFSNVWECACGQGHLSEVLRDNNILGKESDLIDRGCGESIDFLNYSGKWEGDIITNPPYKYSKEFIMQAMSVIDEGRKIAMFFPQRYLSGKGRYDIFKNYPPKAVYAFSGRVGCALNGDFDKHSNSAVDYLWIVWIKGNKQETILRWIL